MNAMYRASPLSTIQPYPESWTESVLEGGVTWAIVVKPGSSNTPLPSGSRSRSQSWNSGDEGKPDAKTTYLPLELIATIDEAQMMLCSPSALMLTRVVVPSSRSRTNTSHNWLSSPATRLSAHERKATSRPSAEITAQLLTPFASPPSRATLMRVSSRV